MGFDKRSAFCYRKHSMPRSPRTHSMKIDVKLPQSSLLPFARPLRWPSQAVPPPHSAGYIIFLSQCNDGNQSFNHSHHDETALKISSKSACNVRNSGGGGAGVEGGEL